MIKIHSNSITCISILSKQLSGKDGLDGDICIGWIVQSCRKQKFRQVKCVWKEYDIIKKVGCNVVDGNVREIRDNGGKDNGWIIIISKNLWYPINH